MIKTKYDWTLPRNTIFPVFMVAYFVVREIDRYATNNHVSSHFGGLLVAGGFLFGAAAFFRFRATDTEGQVSLPLLILTSILLIAGAAILLFRL
jgi:DMSO reductase anchor subunit